MKTAIWLGITAAALALAHPMHMSAQTAARSEPVILDTDIGDDIDDAFALGLVLTSPELKLLGITTEFGDTELRARLAERYLTAGRADVPVYVGIPTKAANVFSQAAYAKQNPLPIDKCMERRMAVSQIPVPKSEEDRYEACEKERHDAIAFLLSQAKARPGEITLIAIGPLTNVKAAIDRDPEGFRKFKRVVLMGGSVDRGYDGPKGERRPADAEWNFLCDPAAAEALLQSGVPVFVLPLDSTQVKLPAAAAERIYAHGSPVTDQIALLYHEWAANSGAETKTPTLFDPVAVTFAFRPELCPAEPMRLQVDEKGFSRRVEGKPNASVCLVADEAGFLKLLEERLTGASKP